MKICPPDEIREKSIVSIKTDDYFSDVSLSLTTPQLRSAESDEIHTDKIMASIRASKGLDTKWFSEKHGFEYNHEEFMQECRENGIQLDK